MDRWEADDALATAAARWVGEVAEVRILTPDKDLGQSLRGSRVVQVDRVRNKVIDEAALRVRRGIRPESIPDWLALVGDDADGIPGLPGFGERTATTLLARWIHLDAIPDDPRRWEVDLRGAPALAETLRTRREDALLYRKLATLVADVPLAESFADLEWRGVPRARFEAWCDAIGVTGLKTRPERWT
jgi:5'-3' exonuclease